MGFLHDGTPSRPHSPPPPGLTTQRFLFGTSSKPDITDNDLTVYLLLIDPERERQIGLGRNFNHPPLRRNEVYISESALRTLHMYNNEDPTMNQGQMIHLNLDIIGALSIGGNLAI